MKRTIKIMISGILIWFIPFVMIRLVSALQRVGIYLPGAIYGAIDVVVLVMTTGVFLVLYFRKLDSGFLSQGFIVGFIWLVMNLIINFFFYSFYQIPNSYMVVPVIRLIMIPVCSITVGYVAQAIAARNKARQAGSGC